MKGVDEMDGRAILGLLVLIVVGGMWAVAFIRYGNIQKVGDKVIESIVSKDYEEKEDI